MDCAINGCCDKSGHRWVPLFWCALVTAGLSFPSLGLAVPPATTQVSKRCELQVGGYALDQYDSGQKLFSQTTGCDLAIASGTATGAATAQATAQFGPDGPRVGVAGTEGQIASDNGIARADFAASVQFHFQIQPIDTVPGSAPGLLPVTFSAYGEGFSERVGYGLSRSTGAAQIFGSPLSFADGYVSFQTEVVDEIAYDPVDTEYQGGGFDIAKQLSLYPLYTYGVIVSAACSMWAGPVGQDAAASAKCGAVVDPSLSFDQAAFDTQMGSNTFQLNDYYRFVLSENVALVPEPPTAWLLLSSLSLLWLVGRRRSRRWSGYGVT